MIIYCIGSLRNPQIPIVAEQLRAAGHSVFDDWYAAGPEADDKWRDYEQARGHSYIEGLAGFAANHVYRFDRTHLDRCEAAVLVLPAGRSGHLELGYIIGTGKPAYILLDDPERWDVMYRFADGVYYTVDELVAVLDPPRTFAQAHEEARHAIDALSGVGDIEWAKSLHHQILEDIEANI